MSPPDIDWPQLEKLIAQAMLRDRSQLSRRLGQIRSNLKRGQVDQGVFDRFMVALEKSVGVHQHRRLNDCSINFPPGLPISEKIDEIGGMLATNQVLVVAGETGSGKTTQLPKMLLANGYGEAGMIACTQPRRIAARSVASRVAEELATPLGSIVGFQVRFSDKTSEATRIKFMTDGILLAETRADPELMRYDAIILDEAHERSLNIDFLLGYLKRLLVRRPELKLVITSATIDTARFSAHFDEAPVVEVSGRSYPIEMRYRPLLQAGNKREIDQNDAVLDALRELWREEPRGDVLVFFSTEREIRDAAKFLGKQALKHTEILSLFARLSAEEQALVFKTGVRRRVILATNIAETSLTVPGIRFVIDTGFARISRYSHRTKVQRLPIEPISRASANQRAGRCGRVSAGTCIRLYDEQDYLQREEFTAPEILRTSLATVILQMLNLRLGDVAEFPFVEPPPLRMINDGYQVLAELQTIDEDRRITDIGRLVARLAVDVRLGRILVAASQLGCLSEALVLVAGLSIQDPRERPLEAQAAADKAHAEFTDERSDFSALLNLWRWLQENRGQLRGSPFRKLCRRQFLSFPRVLEWQDLYRQLKHQCQDMKWELNNTEADYGQIHRALLTGLISHVGKKDERTLYEGARSRQFGLFPGSGLFQKPPQWVVAGQLVETSKLYARMVASIDPAWLEKIAAHLIKQTYQEPHWVARTGRVMAFEQCSLFGLILVSGRRVHFGPLDPVNARELMIRDGLVGQDMRTRLPFYLHNRQIIEQIGSLEDQRRRRDLLLDDDRFFELYDQLIPPELCTQKALERWYESAAKGNAKLLHFSEADLMQGQTLLSHAQLFPERLHLGHHEYGLSYDFSPGEVVDGVCIHVPVQFLNSIGDEELDWLVPGLLREKVEFFLRGLPKSLRRNFIPVPEYVQMLIEALQPGVSSLARAAAGHLFRVSGAEIPESLYRQVEYPDHLQFLIRVVDERGEVLGQSRSLADLQASLAEFISGAFLDQADTKHRRRNIEHWDFGDLPEEIVLQKGHAAYPALMVTDTGIDLELFETAEQAAVAGGEGLRCLLQLELSSEFKYLGKKLVFGTRTCLIYSPLDSGENLLGDLLYLVSLELCGQAPADIRRQSDFESLVQTARGEMMLLAERLRASVEEALATFHAIGAQMDAQFWQRWPEAAGDIAQQLANLIYSGFLRDLGSGRLQHYPRYLLAVSKRIEKLQVDPQRDQRAMAKIMPAWVGYLQYWEDVGSYTSAFDSLRWLLEEYRVSLFAQPMKTQGKVSAKRVDAALAVLTDR